MIVVSTGCPASIGPEVSVRAAARWLDEAPHRRRCVLVGDPATLLAAAELVGVDRERLVAYGGKAPAGRLVVMQSGPVLSPADRRPGKPNAISGRAQLAYVNDAYDLVASRSDAALVTAAVSKAVINGSGARGARRFLGHTEWLGTRDGADETTMCFAAEGLVSGLVTTHLPLAKVPRALSADAVARAVVHLAELLRALGTLRPKLAVCSLNPHAGEGELLGKEETKAIIPGIDEARRRLSRKARVVGPMGAETAFRKAYAGAYDGVLAMYHDQATIPMKLVAFGRAVNVTVGLSVVRTSVDHGTGYDIAWRGSADCSGMLEAIVLAERLRVGRARRRA